ncbi:MAG: caspase family protein [Paracoccaceae bacterium]
MRFLKTVSLLALLAGGTAQAENYALLIGASTYDNLDERYWLKGPSNDVDLIRTYLTETSPVPFSTDNVFVLADGLEGSEKPTLAAIREEFARLAEVAGEGDFVYLHFSGHGTQAPALNPETELDGLDELFLPVDIGPWNDTVGAVENGLVDDEIGELIGAIRAKGASVWAVFDSCHSGTVTRAAPDGDDDTRLRKLDTAALGVPEDAMLDAEANSRALPDPRQRGESPAGEALAGSGGQFVAFYAAQTNETTPEKRLPRGKPGRRSQGVFTYTIFETLAESPGLTYRQLGQEVLRKYLVNNLAMSTPMFEGDLDGYVFSGEAGEKVTQWPVRDGEYGLSVRAGHLQGLAEGEVLAILPTAASTVEDAIGHVRVTYADTFTADIEPVAHEGLDALDPADIPRGAFLRRLGEPIYYGITVALPDLDIPWPEALDPALAHLIRSNPNKRIRFVEPGTEGAAIRLAVIPDSSRPDAVWMLPGSGFFDPGHADRIPSVSAVDATPEEIAARLQDNLDSIARVVNVLRMGSQFDNLDLLVDMQLQTKSRRQRELTDLDTSNVPILVPDDQVHVLMTNNEEFPVDANVLHIGSDYSISHFFRGRLQPGDTLKKGLFRITDEAFGRDRVIVILTPADPQSDVEDLRFLAQDAVQIVRGEADGGSEFAKALFAAGFGTTTRGAVALDDDSGATPVILQFDIDTVPGE